MKIIKSDQEEKYGLHGKIREKKEIINEDPLKKISGNIQALKDTIDRGIRENKSETAIVNELMSKLSTIMQSQILTLKNGINDLNRTIKEVKFPEAQAPAKKFKVLNIDRDVNDNLKSFDIEVVR